MLDLNADPCQSDVITVAVSSKEETSAVVSTDRSTQVITSKWGGPRANSGGPRVNSGGARPGAGRKPKPHAPIIYTTAVPVWCVIAFWGNAEVSATTELSRIGYDTYLPMVAIRRQDPVVKSMWHTVRVPYLPGYGFIRITQSQSREPIQAVRGIRDVLRRPDGKAAWVRDGIVDRMRDGDEDRLELPKEHGPRLVAKAVVRISVGAFAGHTGTVVECDGIKTMVEVLIFGRPTPVWLDRVSVEQEVR